MVLGFSGPSWDTRKGCWGQELLKPVELLELVELMEPMEPVELMKPQWPLGPAPGATDVVSAGAVTSGAAGSILCFCIGGAWICIALCGLRTRLGLLITVLVPWPSPRIPSELIMWILLNDPRA